MSKLYMNIMKDDKEKSQNLSANKKISLLLNIGTSSKRSKQIAGIYTKAEELDDNNITLFKEVEA